MEVMTIMQTHFVRRALSSNQRPKEYEGRILRRKLTLHNLSHVFQFNGRGNARDHS